MQVLVLFIYFSIVSMAVTNSSSPLLLQCHSLVVLSVHTTRSSVWMAASPEVSESAVCCCIRAFVSFPFTVSLTDCADSLLCQYHLVYFQSNIFHLSFFLPFALCCADWAVHDDIAICFLYLFVFLHSVAEDYCLGSIMLNASVPKRSQQLMT